MDLTPTPIELHIAELVIDGIAVHDTVGLGAAVRRELTRIVAERGVPSGWLENGRVNFLDGGTIPVAEGASAETVGEQISHALYGGSHR